MLGLFNKKLLICGVCSQIFTKCLSRYQKTKENEKKEISFLFTTMVRYGERVFDSSILCEEPFVYQLGEKKMHEGFERGLQCVLARDVR